MFGCKINGGIDGGIIFVVIMLLAKVLFVVVIIIHAGTVEFGLLNDVLDEGSVIIPGIVPPYIINKKNNTTPTRMIAKNIP
ncbi:MAG: hypothetical protein QXQ64_08315 [Candidatus Bathyarchaeia archaeon]